MRRVIALAAPFAAALALVACGGVDREGTRDQIVESIEEAGGTVDEECIDTALDEYSDDELQDIDDALGSGETNEAADALLESLFTCVTFG